MRRPGRARERQAPPWRSQRPRRQRHWPAVPIDADLWWRQVRALRVTRADVEATLRAAQGDGPRAAIDPHDLAPGGSPAQHAVTYLLVATAVPTYAALMYVAHAWSTAGRSLKEWIVAQYAQLIDSDDPRLREAALYSLWCDYFEVPARATFVFPRLLKAVRREAELLAGSGPVPWPVKRAAYQAAAADPALHAALARGLAGSFFDVYGSVEPVEARALVAAIVIEDEAVRTALARVTTTPTRWRLKGVARVDEGDARWRRWLPAGSTAPSFLVSLEPVDRPSWVPGSELRLGGADLGRLVHLAIPFDPAIRHDVDGTLGAGVLFRIEGDPAAARAAIGAEVEAWPAGLAPTE